MVMLTACASDEADMATADWDDEEVMLEVAEDDWDDDDAEWAAEVVRVGRDGLDDMDETEAPQAAEEEERAFDVIPILLPSESGRQLAYTVRFNLESPEFMRGVRRMWQTIGELGGYLEHDSINGRSLHQPYIERSANFEIRIPNEQLAAFLMFVEGEYNIVGFSRNLNDFTFAYERNIDNLEALREQEQRVSDELDGDEEPEATQDDLAEVRALIRNLEESNIIIQRDVDYSDVAVRLNEVIMPVEEIEEEPESFGERLQDALGGAARNLVNILQVLTLVVVTILPWVLVAAAIVVPIVYAVRKHRKKNGKDKLPDDKDNILGDHSNIK